MIVLVLGIVSLASSGVLFFIAEALAAYQRRLAQAQDVINARLDAHLSRLERLERANRGSPKPLDDPDEGGQ